MENDSKGWASMRYAETNKTELKEIMTEEIKREIIAFLNADGGTIFVGVKDDGTIIPYKDAKERDELDIRLSNWVRDAFYPNVSTLLKYHFNEDGIFVIEVGQGTEKPYYLKEKGPKPSGVYVRIGTTTRTATESEILLMLLDSKKYSYEEDASDEQELTFRFFNETCDENHIPHEERSLRSLRMINKDGKYTNLGFMMSDQSDIVVKFAKYDKNLNFLIKKEFKGSLLKCLENALDNAANFNDISAVISPDSWQRKETVSYPGSSLREAILNAFCHSNYFIRSNIKIEFYENKVKITNPGGINQTTLEQIMAGVQTYRNPGLVNILSKLHYIENSGTGIPRILEAYEGAKKQPIFDPSGNFFILTLPNLNYVGSISDSNDSNDQINDSNYSNKDSINDLNGQINDSNDSNNDSNDNSFKLRDSKLNDFDLAVLQAIQASPGISTKAILESVKASFPDATVFDIKNSFKRKIRKYVEYKGSRRKGGYSIKKEDI